MSEEPARATRRPTGTVLPRILIGSAVLIAIGTIIGVAPPEGEALPSFTRQTGLSCGVCHTVYPQLTPFGRRFKLGGYTMTMKSEANAGLPPVSIVAQLGYTHTQANAATPLNPNDNLFLQSATLSYYGGAINEHLGAFAQITYTAPTGPGPQLVWDMHEIRYATTGTWRNEPVTYGFTLHNMPTLQDVWNTVSVWNYPFITSTLAPAPSAHTILDGVFSARVIGESAYAFINDTIYVEAAAYKELAPDIQRRLGIDPTTLTVGHMDSVAPYFRVAYEPHWGNTSLEVGAFALFATLYPYPLAGTDRYTDYGFDSQYQVIGSDYSLTVRASLIREDQALNASFPTRASNATDQLNKFTASLAYVSGKDNRVQYTGAIFSTYGTPDALLYPTAPNSPNSSGWIAEVAWMPFGDSLAPYWPSFNTQVGLQYTNYSVFNGTSTNAGNSNTLFLYTWVAW